MEPLEPLQVAVLRPGGEVATTLMVNPRTNALGLKRQIAGLEGTPVGNQALLLEGQPLGDEDRLADLGLQGNTATVVLLVREPLLSGRLTEADLHALLESTASLDQAIDACTDDPGYPREKAEGIAAAVSAALLPRDAAGAGAGQVPQSLLDELSATSSGRPAARRAAFTRAVRAALESVRGALDEATGRPGGVGAEGPRGSPRPAPAVAAQPPQQRAAQGRRIEDPRRYCEALSEPAAQDTIEFTITRSRSGSAGLDVCWNPLRVSSVEPYSPAHRAGMQDHVGWIVTHVDDVEVTDENARAAVDATRGPDRTFTIRVKRLDKDQREAQLITTMFDAVVRDDTVLLAQLLQILPWKLWSRWRNAGGIDLLEFSQERGCQGARSLLAEAWRETAWEDAPRGPQQPAAVQLRHTESAAEEAAPAAPWRGAGSELEEKLHRRFDASEGRRASGLPPAPLPC